MEMPKNGIDKHFLFFYIWHIYGKCWSEIFLTQCFLRN